MSRRFLCAATLLVLVATGARAQYPLGAASLYWVGASGSTGGSFCWDTNFTCVPDVVTVTAGEQVTVTIRGEFNAPWLLAIANAANQCAAIPGIGNALILDASATPALSGVLALPSPILACPPGVATFGFAFPPLPPGTSFAIQSLVFGAGFAPVFTKAITVNVI